MKMTSYIVIVLFLLVSGAHARCPPSYTLVGGRCLWFMKNVDQDFLNASLSCSFFGGSLAKIDNCNLLTEVTKYTEVNDLEGHYWIGATDFVEEGNFLWTDGTQVQKGAPLWDGKDSGDFEPFGDGEDCVALDPNDGFYFHSVDCSRQFTPICEIDAEKDVSCPPSFVLIAGGCYRIQNKSNVTWEEARINCQLNGGDLAVINDCSKMGQIISYTEKAGWSTHFWIGGVKLLSSWVWIDGSYMDMGPPFWGRNQDNGLEPFGTESENCVFIQKGRNRIRDAPCTNSYHPLCETSPVI